MDKTVHISPEANRRIPPEIQALVWLAFHHEIEREPPKNYLQSFLLSAENEDKPTQKIRYWRESAAMVTYHFPIPHPISIELFILNDSDRYTMILREELEEDPYE